MIDPEYEAQYWQWVEAEYDAWFEENLPGLDAQAVDEGEN